MKIKRLIIFFSLLLPICASAQDTASTKSASATPVAAAATLTTQTQIETAPLGAPISTSQTLAQVRQLKAEKKFIAAQTLLETALNQKNSAAAHVELQQELAQLLFDRAEPLLSSSTYGFQEAIVLLKQALPLFRATHQRFYEGATLHYLGYSSGGLSRYEDALNYYKQAMVIWQELGDQAKSWKAVTVNYIALTYGNLARFPEELVYLKQSLELQRAVKSVDGEALSLNNIAGVYTELNDSATASDYFQQSYALFLKNKIEWGQALASRGIASTYARVGHYAESLQWYQKASVIQVSLNMKADESATQNAIGQIYYQQGHYKEALAKLYAAREIARELSDAAGLNNYQYIGLCLTSLGQPTQAANLLTQDLTFRQQTGDLTGAAATLRALMKAWRVAGKPEVAIFYGKQAVNTYQIIRANLHGLSPQLQRSYLSSKQEAYRELADLLIQQKRPSEAEQVLQLLKRKEFDDFSQLGVSPSKSSSSLETVKLTDAESEQSAKYEALSARAQNIGAQNRVLDVIPVAQQTTEQQAQAQQLQKEQSQVTQDFDAFFAETTLKLQDAKPQPLAIPEADEMQARLLDWQKQGAGNVAVVYMLVGSDSYRVILETARGRQAFSVKISPQQLNRDVDVLRWGLNHPNLDPTVPAAKMYQTVFCKGALNTALQKANIKTILWFLDGKLRYVPMAALYDSTAKQYMVSRYCNVVLTPSSSQSGFPRPQTRMPGLGAGVSLAHEVNIKSATASPETLIFEKLDTVPDEVRGVIGDKAQGGSGPVSGQILLDSNFTAASLVQALKSQPRVVHLASHFYLQPGNATNSFLLLGDGTPMSMAQWRQRVSLRNVDLLTLSACETAMGDTSEAQSGGKEVDSLGETAQRQGAGAVVASLWPVADSSTTQLMQKFYGLRQSAASFSTVEALRQAQLGLLNGESKTAGQQKSGTRKTPARRSANTRRVMRGMQVNILDKRYIPLPAFNQNDQAPYAHPYYWAPFILIGNWR